MVDGDSEHDALFVAHRLVVLVPIGMRLSRRQFIVPAEQRPSFGQANHSCLAIDYQILPKFGSQHQDGSARIALQVSELGSGLRDGNEQLSLVVRAQDIR